MRNILYLFLIILISPPLLAECTGDGPGIEFTNSIKNSVMRLRVGAKPLGELKAGETTSINSGDIFRACYPVASCNVVVDFKEKNGKFENACLFGIDKSVNELSSTICLNYSNHIDMNKKIGCLTTSGPRTYLNFID